MPCSATSRPGRLDVLLDPDAPQRLHRPQAAERRREGEDADRRPGRAPARRAGGSCPCRRGRPCPWPGSTPERGTAKRPTASVPQTPAMPCTATAPIGSSIPIRSTQSTPTTAIAPAAAPITTAAHGATKPDAAVIATSAAITPFSIIETSGLRRTSQAAPIPPMAPAAAAMVRRQRDVGEVADLVARHDAERRARVEAEPAEPEDQRPEDGVRHVVARNRVRAPVVAELADPRAEQQRAGERGERALVVHDGRAGEVLHALREEPAARVPDPVRDDRVEDGEERAEDEVDPELRPLGHRAPDDRERDAREDDLEQVAGRARDRREEAERRRADRQELVGRREEAARPDRASCRRRRRSRSPTAQ